MNPRTGRSDPAHSNGLAGRLSHELHHVLPQLVRSALSLVDDPSYAEDLVQDTLLAALRSGHRFRRGAELLPWLRGILCNCARRHRRCARRQIDAERLHVRTVGEPSESLACDQLIEIVGQSIARLPPLYRDVVRMHVMCRRTIQEIAALLDRPESTVRTQLSRGLERVRSLLPPGISGP
jgi:RNA polymerase sigma-70 factor (ECF subfamily)